MTYYNKNYKKIKIGNMKYLNSGACGRIFYNRDMIFKQYFFDTEPMFRINENLFYILKNIANPHFIELYDIYSKFHIIDLFKNKIGLSPFHIDAYTAKYYPDNSINVLYEHKDYLLDNFKELESLLKIFTENMICTNDLKRDNCIIGKDCIVIIDPDLFYIKDSSKKDISTLNKKELLELFRNIFRNFVPREENYVQHIKYIDNELARIEVNNDTDITYEISKKLKYVKKPIELFRK